jgi:5-carboxymethyl-2-hydroxymuconate isomerase
MTHMTLEYSSNLRAAGDLKNLCLELARFMTEFRADGAVVFPAGGVRVRAIPCDDFCIADGSVQDAGFVHAILKIGAGRTPAVKDAVVAGLFSIMKQHFAAMFAARGLALSLEFQEFSEAGTLKHNNLHARFRPTTTT